MATTAETERLYRADPYLRAFEATVVECAPRAVAGGGASGDAGAGAADALEVVLDRSAFYPGGGGQPADTGALGGAPVAAAREGADGRIVHVISLAAGPVGAGDALTALGAVLSPGAGVRGEVAFERRLDLMRHHTGQHLLSAAILRRLRAETVSVHFSDEAAASCSLDLARGPLSDAEVDAVEDEALRVLLEDRPVTSAVHPVADAPGLGLRKPPPEDQMAAREGLRIVTIEGYDVSACCGTHVRRTGEIGPLRIVGQEKVRGQARMRFVVGGRAVTQERARARAAEEALLRASAARRLAEKRAEAHERRLAERIGAEWALGVRAPAGAASLAGAGAGGGPGAAAGAGAAAAGPLVSRVLSPEDPRPEWIVEPLTAAGARASLARALEGGQGVEVVLARPAAGGPDVAALGKAALGPLGARGGGKASFARFTLPASVSPDAALAAVGEGMRA